MHLLVENARLSALLDKLEAALRIKVDEMKSLGEEYNRYMKQTAPKTKASFLRSWFEDPEPEPSPGWASALMMRQALVTDQTDSLSQMIYLVGTAMLEGQDIYVDHADIKYFGTREEVQEQTIEIAKQVRDLQIAETQEAAKPVVTHPLPEDPTRE